MNARRVALVGLSGAGKTEAGRALAAALGRPFLDLDGMVEESTGCTVTEVFASEGEAGFRVREGAALRVAAGMAGDPVVATGGGVVEAPENRSLLAEAFTVLWLTVTPARAAERLSDHEDRPLLAGEDPAAALADLLARRHAHYAAVADAVIPVGERGLAEVVEALQAALRALETNP